MNKLYKLLTKYLYNNNYENQNITIYLNEYWFSKITSEVVGNLGHWNIDASNNQICFELMTNKITFIPNGNECNKETKEFFDLIYSLLP